MEPWLVTLLKDFGPLGVLVAAVLAITRGYFVPKQHHAEVVEQYRERLIEAVEDRDYYRDLALTALRTAEKSTGLAERRQERV